MPCAGGKALRDRRDDRAAGLLPHRLPRDSSVRYSDKQIADYAEYGDATKGFYGSQNQVQAGDPAKLGAALMQISRDAEPPLRLAMGSDAVQFLGQAYEARQEELAKWAELSRSTDFEAAAAE